MTNNNTPPPPQVTYRISKDPDKHQTIYIEPEGILYNNTDEQRPIPPLIPPQPTTLIIIASYRDGERCGRTILDAFTNAKYPDRINFAVVDQVGPEDVSCVDWYCYRVRRRRRRRLLLLEEEDGGVNVTRRMLSDEKKNSKKNKSNKKINNEEKKKKLLKSIKEDIQQHKTCERLDQIRNITLDWTQSFGPVHARSYGHSLIHNLTSFDNPKEGEAEEAPDDFCLQIDGHSRFTPSFDTDLLSLWSKTQNEYAILTTYVHDTPSMKKEFVQTYTPHVCLSQWGSWGIVRNSQAVVSEYLVTPKLNWAWCAGMSYMKCHGELKVPNDPHLKQVFDGEEFGRGVRLWTNGYDIYTPSENYVFHDYSKIMIESKVEVKDKQVWSYNPPPIPAEDITKQITRSKKRLHTLFGMNDKEEDDEDLGEYGLGSVRTLDQFYEFSGVDPRGGSQQKRRANGTTCGDLMWIPWNGNTMDEAIKRRDDIWKKHVSLLSSTSTSIQMEEDENWMVGVVLPSSSFVKMLYGIVLLVFFLAMVALRTLPSNNMKRRHRHNQQQQHQQH